MSQTLHNILTALLIAVISFVIGFGVSRCTIKTDNDPHYEQLPPIHDTVDSIQILYKKVPIDIDTADLVNYLYSNGKLDYLKLHDTIQTEVDTTAIINEFITKNYYSIELFNTDTLGKCSIDAEVQFNQLSHLEYTYTPIQRINTITQKKSLEFMLGGGVGVETLPGYQGIVLDVDAGVIIKEHYMLQYLLQFDSNKKMNHNIILNYKF